MSQEEAKVPDYEATLDMLHGLVGHFEDMKPLDDVQEATMCALAISDVQSEFSGRVLSDEAFERIVKKDKAIVFVTVLYLYCNWRVWATYKHDKELAKKYQSVCDDIDGYIFDHYDKKAIRYFVQETD